MSQPRFDPVVFVLRHTHWDREWYHPAPVFRKRLVDLIDELLTEGPNAPFLLDGQAIVIRDYLAVRPERAAELASAVQSGRLEAGPWYVLPDELIPSGEALVRNLLAGRRALRQLRAAPPDVLYCPDSFGHPAALPAIAAGFGCGVIVVWRGYGSRRFPRGDAATWVAPSGERAVLFHLAPSGYEFGSNLPADETAARQLWSDMRRVLQARSTLGVWLVPNGADHHAAQLAGAAALAALERAAAPVPVIVAGLRQFSDLVRERADHAALATVHGELRDSYGFTWTLAGTLATRAHQKRGNAQLERQLTREVEPWAALARLAGRQSQRHHLHAAWEMLLGNHPHDSLCGCSVDVVAASVDARMAELQPLAEELRRAAVAALVEHDPDAARSRSSAWQAAVLVRNRAARRRAGIAELQVDVALAHVPVGPGSAGGRRPLVAPDALPVPVQIVARETRYARIEAPRFYPVNHEIERRHCLAWVPEVPAYGILALPLSHTPATEAVPVHVTVKAAGHALSSALGTLTAARTGVQWRARGSRQARTLFHFESVADVGDTYTPSLRGTATRGLPRRSRTSMRGPLRAAIDTTWSLRSSRRSRRPNISITTRTALDAGCDFIRVRVTGINGASDQRLRILFDTGLRPRRVLADSAFALVERKKVRVSVAERRSEAPPPTAPLHRFVTLFDGKRGCTVVSDGLAEYEVTDAGHVAITLVRSVAELSRANLPERPGHAGWPAPTPLAQCLGPFEAEFAIAWHGGDSTTVRATILDVVDATLLPLVGETQRDLAAVPAPVEGIMLEGRGLAFSTLKESDDGRSIVARCVNVTDKPVDGAWILPRPVAAALRARLDETPLAPIAVDGGRIPLSVPAHGIDTVLIVLADAR